MYEQWWRHEKGPDNPVEKKVNSDSLSEMQTTVPALAVRCGGACNAWWYNDSWWYQEVWYAGKSPSTPVTDPITGVVGTRVSTSELSGSATSHKTYCNGGCYHEYWSCKDADVRKHEVLYCGKSITYYKHDSLSGNWGWYSLGICGASYRRCDDPKKQGVHRYLRITQYNQDSWGNWGVYTQSYRADTPTAHGTGKGKECLILHQTIFKISMTLTHS